MKYNYSFSTKCKDEILFKDILSAAKRLEKKLNNLNLKSLGLSEYNTNYLTNTLSNPYSALQQNTYLMALSLDGHEVKKDNFTLVDYGGGSGLFSLLAKELGIMNVIYLDIYDVSCNDIKILSKKLDLSIDTRICGDIDTLLSYLEINSIKVNTICSFDVIEHIYDIPGFLRKCKLIPGKSLRLVFGSGANESNPVIKHKLQKGHLFFEFQEKPKTYGYKQRDSLKSFYELRREIITNYTNSLTKEEVEIITKQTRGLRNDDIIKQVENYKLTGKLNYSPNHPTNTCDPMNGNWNEQLLNPYNLANILREQGFDTDVLEGYWGDGIVWYKTFIKRIFNLIILLSPRKLKLIIAPYYLIYSNLKK